MARNRPVISWIPRQSPRRDPKFHKVERFRGAGRWVRWRNIFVRGDTVIRVKG